MNRILTDKKYSIRCTFEDRHIYKDAGFEYNKKTLCWETLNPWAAHQLRLTDERGFFGILNPNTFENLFPYQSNGTQRATHALKAHDFHCIGDVMGLGKTPQAISVARHLGAKRIAIICLANSRQVWVDHIYGNPDHKPNPIHQWGQELAENPCDIVYSANHFISGTKHLITSYSLAPKVLELAGNFDFIILDECQALSNPMTYQTHAVLDFCEKNIERGAKVLGLSGTWPKNCPIELWPILHRIGPTFFKQFSYSQFAERYCKPWTNPKTGAYIVSGFKNTEELNFNLKNLVMTRREIHEVRDDLPDPTFHFVQLEATHDIESALKEEKEIYNRLSPAQKKGKMSLGEYAQTRKRIAILKANLVITYIRKQLESGLNKACVFCHTVELAKILEKELKVYCAVRVTGDTPARNRDAIVETFQSDPSCRLFVGNIQAAGMAITLTAASTLFFAETSWVPGDNDQVIGRIRRHGQTEPVHVKFLVIKGSLDEQILKRAYEKKEGLNEVLNRKETDK